jgi:anti-sigma regulatory factor (Ser/Thr protein kinase)
VIRGNLLLRMELRSNPGVLCAVRGALGKLTEALGLPDAECRAVVLAVDEALTNIIRHAYQGKSDKPIEATFRRISVAQNGNRSEALEIVLQDHGVTVDRKNLCGRPLEEIRPGGLGLHFIRESVDKVEFQRRNGKNQLRLIKFLREAKPQTSC